MCAIDTSEMNWLESKGNFSRYDTLEAGDSRSIWVCDDCGEEADHDDDDHDCIVVDAMDWLESSWNRDGEIEEEEEECCDE